MYILIPIYLYLYTLKKYSLEFKGKFKENFPRKLHQERFPTFKEM